MQEAEHVAHALRCEAAAQQLSPERFDVGGADVGDLAVSEMRPYVDALHVLACLDVGLARAAQLDPLTQGSRDLFHGRDVGTWLAGAATAPLHPAAGETLARPASA